MVQDMDAGAHDGLDGLLVPLEVGNEHFDASPGIVHFDPKHGLCEMSRAAVGEIVSVDRCDHDMLETQLFDHQSYIARLFRIQEIRLAFADRTEAAASRTHVPQDQKRSRTVSPALSDIRAAGLLTNRVEAALPQDVLEMEVVGAPGKPDFEPVWMASGHTCFNSA